MLGNVLNPPAQSLPYSRTRRRRRSISKYLRQSFIAVIAFLVAASLLRQIIPSPVIPSNVVFISPKYDYYQNHKDEYDTLFWGSSRIYSHIVPEVFDDVAEANGVALNSYNFGIPAMRAIDSTVWLEQVLSDPPKNLKWVFFEVNFHQKSNKLSLSSRVQRGTTASRMRTILRGKLFYSTQQTTSLK